MKSQRSKNKETIISETSYFIGDPKFNVWTKEEIGDEINNAFLELCYRTYLLRSVAVLHVVSGAHVYTLPYNILAFLKISFGEQISGTLVFPKNLRSFDIENVPVYSEGNQILNYYIDGDLEQNEIGVFPYPNTTGDSYTRQTTSGLLRRLTDNGDYLEYDADRALRRLTGERFDYTKEGRIVRDIVSKAGNLTILYARYPFKMNLNSDFPDGELPVLSHQFVKYGASVKLLSNLHYAGHAKKLKYAESVWNEYVLSMTHKKSMDTRGFLPR